MKRNHKLSFLECFYNNCQLGPFQNFNSLTAHLRRKHSLCTYKNLKPEYKLLSVSYPNDDEDDPVQQERTENQENTEDTELKDQEVKEDQEFTEDQEVTEDQGGQEAALDPEDREDEDLGLDQDLQIYRQLNQNDEQVDNIDLQIQNLRNEI